MIDVTRVDYIRVPVDDIEAAQHFYGEVLGLPRNEKLHHDDWIEYEASNVTLAVMTPETHDDVFATFPPGTIALGVPDVAAAKAELEAKGVEFDGETIEGRVCKMATFFDPDGNQLTLHNRFAPYE